MKYLVNLTSLLEIPTADQTYLGIRTLLPLFSKVSLRSMGVTYFFIHTLTAPTDHSKEMCWENWIFCFEKCHFQDGNDRSCEPELFVRTFQSAVPDESESLTSAISANSCPSVASRLFRTIVAPCKNKTDEGAVHCLPLELTA